MGSHRRGLWTRLIMGGRACEVELEVELDTASLG